MSKALEKADAAVAIEPFNQRIKDIARRTVAKDLSNDEFDLFLYFCDAVGAHPLVPGEVSCWKGNDGKAVFCQGIHNLRAKAAATGEYAPGKTTHENNGQKAVVTVRRWHAESKQWIECTEDADLDAYKRSGPQWSKNPRHMLAIRAESKALKRLFPRELKGAYTVADVAAGDYDGGIIDADFAEPPTDNQNGPPVPPTPPAPPEKPPRERYSARRDVEAFLDTMTLCGRSDVTAIREELGLPTDTRKWSREDAQEIKRGLTECEKRHRAEADGV